MSKTLMVIWYMLSTNGGVMHSHVMTWNECKYIQAQAREDKWQVYCYKME